MIVVSDTSPIVNLATIGRLDLLRQLFGRVVIPQSVYEEIAVAGAGQPGAAEVRQFDWIETKQVANRTAVASLQLELDDGEAEAIALAVEIEADLILLDERKGREIASRLGLKAIGLLGVVVEAKQRGLIVAAKPVVDELIHKAGFWIGQDLYDYILKTVGE
jgi:predicted nucleic acid-binding protein